VIMAAGVASAQPAGNALAANLTSSALPGYDAAQKDGLALGAPPEHTTVMNKSGAPEMPRPGTGDAGQEP
jgi:hypothetical protein